MFKFIHEYQALFGSIIAVTGSVLVVWFTSFLNKRREIKNSNEEIEKIFLMAFRESEQAIVDLKLFLNSTRTLFKKEKDEINLFIPPKFNRIFINEERLFTLNKNLNYLFSQQVDIATSAVKRINGYLDQHEETPRLIFDYVMKSFESGLITKEKAVKEYIESYESYLLNIDNCLKNDIKTIQKNILRPIVLQQYGVREFLKDFYPELFDKKLDEGAEVLLDSNNFGENIVEKYKK